MQALLVLYMTGTLLLPGHVEHVGGFAIYRAALQAITGPLSIQALAAQTFGLYVGLIYFTPIFGGLIGDRLLGRRMAVTIGAILMAAGHFALAFDKTFLLALALLIVGAGFLRGNLSAQIKTLYADGDRREGDAFQLYYVSINLASFVSPIVTGALTALYGWHVGFGFAGFGMMVGLGYYLVGQRFLPPDSERIASVERAALTTAERRRLTGLVIAWPGLVAFWIGQSQVWNVYNLWVRDHLNLRLGRFTMPVPWLQSLDGLAPILLLPTMLAFWKRQAAEGREPDDIRKMVIGCAIFSLGTLCLAAATFAPDRGGKASLLWAVSFHAISNAGWLYVWPIALAFYADKAPPSMRGALLGICIGAIFAGSLVSGRLGGLYEVVTPSQFWLLHAAVVGAAAIYFLLVGRHVRSLVNTPLKEPLHLTSELGA